MARKSPEIRIFLDSNVIISGLLSDKGAPRIILDLLCLNLPNLRGLTGRYNLIEVERNLQRKLPLALPVFQNYFPRLNLEIVPLPAPVELEPWAGVTAEKDIPVIVSAINGKADFLITGDHKDFGGLKSDKKIPCKIVTPTEFVNLVGGLLGGVV
ncbi:MAG: PIN domain-containing protein [Geobacteraceae bacterium]|nr:PIN domain-containing protein [Geobacteraceae bacterium]